MMNRFVAPRSLQRLVVTTGIPYYRTTIHPQCCFFSATTATATATATTTCDEVNEAVPDCFQTLGLERSFSIDTTQLKASYRKLMQKLHPDRHRNKSHQEQDELHNRASSVTHAYRVLSAPHHRAVHLLELMGKSIEDESTSTALLGPDFFMEIMDIREAIEECANDNEIRRLLKENEERMEEAGRKLAEAFDVQDLDRALQLTAELQYWNRTQETLREKVLIR